MAGNGFRTKIERELAQALQDLSNRVPYAMENADFIRADK